MAIFVVATLVMAIAFYGFVQGLLERQARSFAESLLIDTIGIYRELGAERFLEEVDERAELDPFSRDIYVVLNADGEPLAGAAQRLPSEMLEPGFLESPEGARGRIVTDFPNQFRRVRDGDERAGRRGSADDAVFLFEPLPEGGSLMVVLLSPQLEVTRELLPRALVWTGGLMALLGLLGAVSLTRLIERRLETLNTLSHDIREGDLTRRVPTDGSGDEFDRLAENLNSMLDRIAELLESSRQVTNDIAHDLRTPLTRMQTRLEALRDSSEYEAAHAVEQVLEDSAEVLRIFDALLRISGVEAGSADQGFETVSLSAVVEDVAELYEPAAAEKDIAWTQSIATDLEVLGDRQLLFQAVANIVENAIKYTPSAGRVRLELCEVKGSSRFLVEDSGPGIPSGELERVFHRFYRLEQHRGSPGNGLGLSLVRAIVEAHGGTISLVTMETGLRVTLELKLSLDR